LYESVGVQGEPDLKLAGLSLWALRRQFFGANDYWDGNWLNIRAYVEAQGACVEIDGPWLRTDEVSMFAEQLAALYRDVKGTAELACMEPALRAKIVCGTLGHLTVTIDITPDHMTQSHRFVFSIDQTYIPHALSACKRLLERYPVIGSP
jgi:hypothetical protein